MANNYTKRPQQKAITRERVVLPKPKPRSTNNTATNDEHHYTALRTIRKTDDPYEPLRFDTELQPQEPKTTGPQGEPEKVAERVYSNLPRIVHEETNKTTGSPSTEGEANEEQISKNKNRICCRKWKIIIFAVLIVVFSISLLLVFAIATAGLSHASNAADSEQELQIMAQQLKEQADDMQAEINTAMATLNNTLHQISTTTDSLNRLRDEMNTFSRSVRANQIDIQKLKTNADGLLTTTAYLNSTSKQLLTTVERLRDTATGNEMAINALNRTFQDYASNADSNLTNITNSINSLSVQPFANCQRDEELNSITFQFLNNSNGCFNFYGPMQMNVISGVFLLIHIFR